MKLKYLKITFLLCCLLGVRAQGESYNDKSKIAEWQKDPLDLYQVSSQRFLLGASGIFAAGNIKRPSAQETDKIENFGGELNAEFGFTEMLAARVQMSYLSGKQKNSLSSTSVEGLEDIAVLLKMKIPASLIVLAEAGIETAPEALKIDNVARTLTASSGGTKAVVKGGVQVPMGSGSSVFGGWAYYKHFLQREMELVSTLGTESLKIDGGNQLGVGGFFEFGTGLRTGLNIEWRLNNRSSVQSINVPTMSDFELEYQQVLAGAYLKVPAGENLLMFIKGDYNFNPNKKRGDQSYDQDELFDAQVGLQALF